MLVLKFGLAVTALVKMAVGGQEIPGSSEEWKKLSDYSGALCAEEPYPGNAFQAQNDTARAYTVIENVQRTTPLIQYGFNKFLRVFGTVVLGHRDTLDVALETMAKQLERVLDIDNDGHPDRVLLNEQLNRDGATIIVVPNTTFLGQVRRNPNALLPPGLQPHCRRSVDMESQEFILINKTIEKPRSVKNSTKKKNVNASRLTTVVAQLPRATTIESIHRRIGQDLQEGWFPLRVIVDAYEYQWNLNAKLYAWKHLSDAKLREHRGHAVTRAGNNSVDTDTQETRKRKSSHVPGLLLDVDHLPCPKQDIMYCGLVLFAGWLTSTYLNIDEAWCTRQPMTRNICSREALRARLNETAHPSLTILLDTLHHVFPDDNICVT